MRATDGALSVGATFTAHVDDVDEPPALVGTTFGAPTHPVTVDAPRDLARHDPAALGLQTAALAVDPEGQALNHTLHAVTTTADAPAADDAASLFDLASSTSGQLRLLVNLTEGMPWPDGPRFEQSYRQDALLGPNPTRPVSKLAHLPLSW